MRMAAGKAFPYQRPLPASLNCLLLLLSASQWGCSVRFESFSLFIQNLFSFIHSFYTLQKILRYFDSSQPLEMPNQTVTITGPRTPYEKANEAKKKDNASENIQVFVR